MVCLDEKQGKFPYDIQHRHAITYKTSSTSDFNTLGDTITRKINKLLTNKVLRQVSESQYPHKNH
jgi:hypothetical protein